MTRFRHHLVPEHLSRRLPSQAFSGRGIEAVAHHFQFMTWDRSNVALKESQRLTLRLVFSTVPFRDGEDAAETEAINKMLPGLGRPVPIEMDRRKKI